MKSKIFLSSIFKNSGELRVCTYCCKVVLSYLQSNNLAADVLADLRALQEELLPPTPDQSCNAQHHDAAFSSMPGSSTPSATPRGTLRRRPSLGFQEEKYAVRTRCVYVLPTIFTLVIIYFS